MKKIISFLTVLCIICIPLGMAHANNNVPNFESYISDFYSHKSNYVFWDKNGNIITDNFYHNTVEAYKSGDIEFIRDKYIEEVYYGEKNQPSKLRNGDIATTKTWSYQKSNLQSTSSMYGIPRYADIEFIVYATIYYDPNTGVISSTNKYLENSPRTSVSFDHLHCPISISPNKTSATFNMSAYFTEIDTNASGVVLGEWIISNSMTLNSTN